MAENIGDYFRGGLAKVQRSVDLADNSARRFKQRSSNPDKRTEADRMLVAAKQKRQLMRAAAAKGTLDPNSMTSAQIARAKQMRAEAKARSRGLEPNPIKKPYKSRIAALIAAANKEAEK
jgi:hypothetical protein